MGVHKEEVILLPKFVLIEVAFFLILSEVIVYARTLENLLIIRNHSIYYKIFKKYLALSQIISVKNSTKIAHKNSWKMRQV